MVLLLLLLVDGIWGGVECLSMATSADKIWGVSGVFWGCVVLEKANAATSGSLFIRGGLGRAGAGSASSNVAVRYQAAEK